MSKPVQNHTDAQFPSYTYPPYAEDEISLVDLAKILVKRKLTILVTFIGVVLLAWIVSVLKVPAYTFTSIYKVAMANNQNAFEPLATTLE